MEDLRYFIFKFVIYLFFCFILAKKIDSKAPVYIVISMCLARLIMRFRTIYYGTFIAETIFLYLFTYLICKKHSARNMILVLLIINIETVIDVILNVRIHPILLLLAIDALLMILSIVLIKHVIYEIIPELKWSQCYELLGVFCTLNG